MLARVWQPNTSWLNTTPTITKKDTKKDEGLLKHSFPLWGTEGSVLPKHLTPDARHKQADGEVHACAAGVCV